MKILADFVEGLVRVTYDELTNKITENKIENVFYINSEK